MTKYSQWYKAIMEGARNRELSVYCERHHIKPRSLGGSDRKSNIVALTYREHFLAHWLLTKMTKGEQRRKMCYVLTRMAHQKNGNKIVSSWRYDIAHRAQRDAMIGRKRPDISASLKGNVLLSKKMMGNQNTLGYKWTPEQRKKLSIAKLGCKRPDVTASKKGVARSKKVREKIRAGVISSWAQRRELSL